MYLCLYLYVVKDKIILTLVKTVGCQRYHNSRERWAQLKNKGKQGFIVKEQVERGQWIENY